MKILDLSDSLSFPSEPPDIGNWFSSYVYESPVLDSNDGFEISEIRKEGFDDEEINGEIDENLRDCGKSGNENDSPVDEGNFLIQGKIKGTQLMLKDRWCLKLEKDLPIMDNSSHKTILELEGKGKTSQKHENSSRPDIEKSYLVVDEDYEGNLLNKKTSQEPKFMPLRKAKYSTLSDTRSQERSLHGEKIVTESVRVNGVRSPKTKTDKENTAKKSPGDGFISTRKNKSSQENDENSLKRPQAKSLKSANASSSSVKRKALIEIINRKSTDAALEIAGKWMCPQKSKPNLGPPLKQLRLEQWVCRRT